MSLEDACLSFHLLPSAGSTQHRIAALVTVLEGTAVLRTFDPERDHLVSFGRILSLAGQTLVSGLIKYKLDRGIDYFLSLGASGPQLVEIWVPVQKARELLPLLFAQPPAPLEALLCSSLDKCFTLHDATRSSLLHNWARRCLPREEYSTSLLQASCFACSDIERIAAKRDWIRTSVTPAISAAEDVTQSSLDRSLILMSTEAAERATEEPANDDDHWQDVLSQLDDLLLTDGLYTAGQEVAMVDLCERLLEHFGTKPLPVKASKKSSEQLGAKPKPDNRHVASQTDLPTDTKTLAMQVSDEVLRAQREEQESQATTECICSLVLLAIVFAFVLCLVFLR